MNTVRVLSIAACPTVCALHCASVYTVLVVRGRGVLSSELIVGGVQLPTA